MLPSEKFELAGNRSLDLWEYVEVQVHIKEDRMATSYNHGISSKMYPCSDRSHIIFFEPHLGPPRYPGMGKQGN